MTGLKGKIKAALPIAILACATAFVAPLLPTAASAQDMAYSVARGGLLYDKWWKVIGGEEPSETHALYPSDAKKAGGTTWRCKECHGWDQKGVDGGYASGSHYTGIKGVDGMAGADPADIIAVLTGDDHGYGDLIGEEDLADLANFVSKGQIDFTQYIDYATKAPKGDAARGKRIFNTTCARCHRLDGMRPKDMEHPLGVAVASNPMEVLHKILNGHPGQNMPAFREFGADVATDVLTYLTELPTE